LKHDFEKYTFEVYREASNSWYANATTNDEGEFFYYKWTTGKTKKSVLLSIDGFVN